MHDSSACIVRDGELLFAVAEERLSRMKHDSGFPQLAIQACLDFAGVPAAKLDEVCFGWPPAGATAAPRPEMFRIRKNAAQLSERAEFLFAFSQHVASAWRRKSFHAALWKNAGAHALCGSSSRARHQRVRLFRLRKLRRGSHGWARRLGSHFHLAWPRWPARSRSNHSVSRFRRIFLQ